MTRRQINLGLTDGGRTYVQENHPPEFVRVYFGPRARLSHWANDDAGWAYEKALCGRYNPPTGWLGTGNQRERDAVESLPICAGCASERKRQLRGRDG